MGLDATVYCDCLETNRLRESPPCPNLISIAPDGSIECRSDDLDTLLSFDQWLKNRACEHQNGKLLSHRIGNMALVAELRNELSREAEKFPTLLNKVLFHGAHASDYLSLNEVRSLLPELNVLDRFVCSNEKNQKYVEEFGHQMRHLAEEALRVGKPISF